MPLYKFFKITSFIFPLCLFSNIYNYFDFDGGVGYRKDEVVWSIAGQNNIPNVLSELKWKDIKMIDYWGKVDLGLCDRFLVRVEGDYGKIYHGVNTDSDWSGMNRTHMFSYSRNNAGRGEAFNLSAALGVPYEFNSFNLTTLGGWALSENHLQQFQGNQIFYYDLDNGHTFSGTFDGLHSNYRTKWQGPWTGFEVSANFGGCCCYGSFEYHWVQYHGTGHWNLRSDFAKDFQQKANDGRGTKVKGGIEFPFVCGFHIGVEADYTEFKCSNGRDETYFYDEDGTVLVGGAKFNECKWRSFGIRGYAGIGF